MEVLLSTLITKKPHSSHLLKIFLTTLLFTIFITKFSPISAAASTTPSKASLKLAVQRGITKIEAAAAIKDCKENIQSTIDDLKQSREVMSSLGGGGGGGPNQREFLMDNAKTWASAAITDASTCLEGFNSGRKVNPGVNKKIWDQDCWSTC